MARQTLLYLERTLNQATRFVDEMRADLVLAARDGTGLPPRVRSVHETPGHTTPEFRTLNVPPLEAAAGAALDLLSRTIAHFAESKRPDRLLLAMEAEMNGHPVLIAEARDRMGSRLFWVQPFTRAGEELTWDEPASGGWQDPGDQEMILDAAFERLPPPRVATRRPPRRPAPTLSLP